MPWPTCEEGFRLRKLTLFASQVVDDFKNLPLPPGAGPRKVVELQEDSPEIRLEDLDLASWKHVLIYFLGVGGQAYALARIYLNGDLDETHYWGQLMVLNGTGGITVSDGQISAWGNLALTGLSGQGTIGPPPGPDPTHWLILLFFSGRRARIFATGDNNLPHSPYVGMLRIAYEPQVDNITSITFYSGDDNRPYRAGTRVEVW